MNVNVSAPAAAFDHIDPLLLSAPPPPPPPQMPPPSSSLSSGATSLASTTFPVLDMSASITSTSSLGASMRSRDFFATCSALHSGTLDKCRVENAAALAKFKKSQWSTAYAIVYTGHLLFYRDQKSAEVQAKTRARRGSLKLRIAESRPALSSSARRCRFACRQSLDFGHRALQRPSTQKRRRGEEADGRRSRRSLRRLVD